MGLGGQAAWRLEAVSQAYFSVIPATEVAAIRRKPADADDWNPWFDWVRFGGLCLCRSGFNHQRLFNAARLWYPSGANPGGSLSVLRGNRPCRQTLKSFPNPCLKAG